MRRFPGFLLILLIYAVELAFLVQSGRREADANRNRVLRELAPRTHAKIEAILSFLGRRLIYDDNSKLFKLPDDFYPENDRDVIAFFGEPAPAIGGSESETDGDYLTEQSIHVFRPRFYVI